MATTYKPGDLVRVDGTTWKVREIFMSEVDGTPAVGLINPDNPGHGTAFRASVLDKIGVRVVGA